jgi:hypothetical protein
MSKEPIKKGFRDTTVISDSELKLRVKNLESNVKMIADLINKLSMTVDTDASELKADIVSTDINVEAMISILSDLNLITKEGFHKKANEIAELRTSVVEKISDQRLGLTVSTEPVKHGDVIELAYQSEELNVKVLDPITVTLGLGKLLPELEEGLLGMVCGEIKKIPVVIPVTHPDKTLVGKAGIISVKVIKIKTKNIEA